MPFEIWSNLEDGSLLVFKHHYAEDALSDIDEFNYLMPEVNATIAQPIADSPAFFPTADDLPGNDYMQQFEMPDFESFTSFE